ncbi:MAG: hydantoinase/oxoprolinase family protein [Burkholderiales bacterium]
MPENNSGEQGARLAADIGGTFTDVVLECGGERWSRKILTTHRAPENALLQGIEETLLASGVPPAQIAWFVHGTTLPTNAILERRGAPTALLTTEGFRDVLEIGDEGRFDAMDLNLVKQAPLVPRELRFTVRERMAADGTVLAPLDEAALAILAPPLKANRIKSLAIGFLHAYANPAHERRASEILGRLVPDVAISLSSDICPEIREYERISTICANAYIAPLVAGYLDRLEQSMARLGIHCPAFLMTSGGGVVPIHLAKRVPIRLVESGPAGGAVLSSSIARALHEDRVLSFDMGGTTAKICFIADGAPQVARLLEVDRAARFRRGSGLPLRIPVVELVEIGAGGGSIASVDAMGRIAVGPQSAGSEPGPACYGRGGHDPTVTDADLVIGKIDPERFAAGTIRLDRDAAEGALASSVGGKLGISTVEAALGVVELVDETMANAVRVHAAELGRDLAAHSIVAFGGAAPLHAARIAEKLGISRIIVPQAAGVGSAVGFLRAPMAYDVVVSRPLRLDAYDAKGVGAILDEMQRKADDIARGLAGVGALAMARTADMRYVGQGSEVSVPFGEEVPVADDLRAAFEERYRALFGRVIPHAPVEVLSWQLRISRETWRANGCEPRQGGAVPSPRRLGAREVFDFRQGQSDSYEVYERGALPRNALLAGPVLVVEDETTTVVPPSFSVRADASGHLILERRPGEEAGA